MNEHIPKFNHDDGIEVNPDLIPEPDLCIIAEKMELARKRICSAS